MSEALPAVRAAAADAVARRPLTLWLVLAAANALFAPYRGLVHDAQLYSAAAVDAATGHAMADDLYFRYGSQDRFTVFTPLAAKVVGLLGPATGFALLYLPAVGLYLFAVQRLTARLVADPLFAVAAMVLAVAAWVPFAGWGTFHAFEPFLTPRLIAVPAVLFAVERALAGRWFTAAALVVVGLAFHPLMGFAGVLVVGGLAAARMPWEVQIAGGVFVLGAVAAVLLDPVRGFRLLGEMDPEWRTAVRQVTPFNFASTWRPQDWARIAEAVAVLGWAAVVVPRVRTLAGVLVAVAALAVGGTFVAEAFPYAVPLQGQPYRALWAVQLLAIPVGFAAAAAWAFVPCPGRQAAAGLAVGWLLVQANSPETWLTAGVCAASAAYLLRGKSAFAGAVLGVAVVLGLESLLMCRGVVLGWSHAAARMEPSLMWWAVTEAATPAVELAAAAGLLVLAVRRPRTRVVLAVVAVLPVLAFGPGSTTAAYRALDPIAADDEFLRKHFELHRFPGRWFTPHRPTVYRNREMLGRLWLRVGANSYYHPVQESGVIFQRETAVEGRRRAAVVRKFEVGGMTGEELRAARENGDPRIPVYEVTDAEFRDGIPAPTADDVRRLANESVDWIVLDREFPELGPASNGRVWVYAVAPLRE